MNNTINSTKCQEPVELELQKKFVPKKQQSLLLAESYCRLGMTTKFQRVSDCGTFLEFTKKYSTDFIVGGFSSETPRQENENNLENSEKFTLHNANFCRDRLCPMCSWRRSYKIFAQVSKIMNHIADKYNFLFLTLTVPNVDADSLSDTIMDLNKSWDRLTKLKRFKSSVCGFFKSLEVTRNKKNGTYHPHFHIVLAVPLDYFQTDKYIPRDEWLSLWRKATRNPSITQVDIRKAKNKHNSESCSAVAALSSAVAEIAKYAVKSSDYLFQDKSLTDSIVYTLSVALGGRRLCSFGGIFAEIQKQLQLDDVEDGDLVHINDDKINPEIAIQIYRYGWSCGAYKLLEVYTKSPNQKGGE